MGNIRIYEKNKIDLDNTVISITITDPTATETGQDLVNFLRDRSNNTGWATTDSDDAALTQIDIDMKDPFEVDNLMMLGLNFNYTAQHDPGSGFVDTVPAINVVAGQSKNNIHRFAAVDSTKWRIIIQGTQTPDLDKTLRQIILTREVRQFAAQPEIQKAMTETNKSTQKVFSGRHKVTRRAGAFACTLVFPPNVSQNDQDTILDLYESVNGRLIALGGGEDLPGGLQVKGFRIQDIFLGVTLNDLNVPFSDGRFAHGVVVKVELGEAV